MVSAAGQGNKATKSEEGTNRDEQATTSQGAGAREEKAREQKSEGKNSNSKLHCINLVQLGILKPHESLN